VPIRLETATVVDVRVESSGARIVLDGGATVEVDRVVLAVGPVANDTPVPVPDSLRERGVFVGNAWDESAVIPALADREVLVIGTGLTMVDVALTLGGNGGPAIRAVSRRGLVPAIHREGLTRLGTPEVPGDEVISINDLLASFTTELARATTEGGDWRDAIDSMRSVTPSAWRRIPVKEKFWFLNNLNRQWEIHRYRMAPEVGRRFTRLVDRGQVTIEAARIESIEDTGSRARVTLLTESGTDTCEFDRVISASGATVDIRHQAPEPIPSLFRQRELKPDDLGLGLDVTPDGRAIRGDGSVSPVVSVIGSLRRGVEWESIGVPELRTQAVAIARRLGATKRGASKAPLS
jgi:uncharacterized NAD(P)/FAD-binding protein YdhS